MTPSLKVHLEQHVHCALTSSYLQLVGFLFGSLREINAKSMKHREREREGEYKGLKQNANMKLKEKNGNCNGVTDLI